MESALRYSITPILTHPVVAAQVAGAEAFGELALLRIENGKPVPSLNLFGLIKGSELRIKPPLQHSPR
jgi:hypothetical protein